MHNILKQQQGVNSILIKCLENTHIYRKCAAFVGTFTLSQKVPVIFIMPASVTMNDLGPQQIFVKFDIGD
jgi:hypothetical protein